MQHALIYNVNMIFSRFNFKMFTILVQQLAWQQLLISTQNKPDVILTYLLGLVFSDFQVTIWHL